MRSTKDTGLIEAYIHSSCAHKRRPRTRTPSAQEKGFGLVRVWALVESEWKKEMQNLLNKFSNVHLILICKHRRYVRTRRHKSVGNQYTHSLSHRWARNPWEKGTGRRQRQRPTPLDTEKLLERFLMARLRVRKSCVGHPLQLSEQRFGDMGAGGGPAATLCSRSPHRFAVYFYL